MRKNRLIIAVFGIAIVFAAYLYFFSNTPVRLAKETTFITSPLAEDGLPNYVLAILERQGNGVTRQNNGARPFWQAVGPGKLDQRHFETLCNELEIEFDSSRRSLVNVDDEETAEGFAGWIAKSDAPSVEVASDRLATVDQMNQANACLKAIQSRAWTREQLPPLAQWVSENDAALDLLVEASQKERFYSPPPNALVAPDVPVVELLLPHAQAAREAVRSLAARAMHRLAADKFEPAWNDVLAVWRFGEHIGSGPTSIESIVGVAIRGIAMEATLAILDSPELPVGVARRILADLGDLDPRIELASSFDFADRAMLLDFTSRLLTGRLGGVEDSDAMSRIGLAFIIDPNIPLKMTNELFDRISTAVALEDWQERDAEIAKIHADLEEMSRQARPSIYALLVGRARHSVHAGSILLCLLAPALDTPISACERDQTELTMAQIAVALAIYRIERLAYPATLHELVDADILPKIPLDPFTRSAFIYERRDPGYVLYSLGKNRADDGGSDFRRPIVDGEWIEEDEFVKTTLDGGDVVIRLPLPPLQLPFESKPIKPSPE